MSHLVHSPGTVIVFNPDENDRNQIVFFMLQSNDDNSSSLVLHRWEHGEHRRYELSQAQTNRLPDDVIVWEENKRTQREHVIVSNSALC